MMAWYAETLARYPDGLVTQAQAAAMLAVSRMAISRLVTRGYLRTVHFPRPPDIEGVAIGQDDPSWLRLAEWLGINPEAADVSDWPKACYVSFADVVKLWQAGQARARCTRDWERVLTEMGPAGAASPPEPRPSTAPTAEPEPPTQDTELEAWML